MGIILIFAIMINMVILGAKTKPRKTTIILSAILTGVILYVLIVYAFYPMYMHSIHYEVYGGMTSVLQDGELYADMESGKSFCFLGDSITKGTDTFGIHWYEPLIPYISGEINDLSHGYWTISDLLFWSDMIPKSDIYVIAIGINDVIHPDSNNSSKTPNEYIDQINTLSQLLLERSPNAKLYFVAPWPLPGWDKDYNNRRKLFVSALMMWCEEKDYVFIDPEPIIMSVINENEAGKYTKDGLHPNAEYGVGLYSYAVLLADHIRYSS